LQAHGHSRKETAEIVGVAPETISVWKRHPQWQVELDRWRELAEAPLDKTQLRLKLESAEATIEALDQLRLIMGSTTKRVRTRGGLREQPRLVDATEGLSARLGDGLRGDSGVSRSQVV
jgi:hypothetical protein